jgi:hypothetical protein
MPVGLCCRPMVSLTGGSSVQGEARTGLLRSLKIPFLKRRQSLRRSSILRGTNRHNWRYRCSHRLDTLPPRAHSPTDGAKQKKLGPPPVAGLLHLLAQAKRAPTEAAPKRNPAQGAGLLLVALNGLPVGRSTGGGCETHRLDCITLKL